MNSLNFYDGILYNVRYQPQMSNLWYGEKKKVYFIHTEDENFSHAKKAITSIMDDGSYTAGEWAIKSKKSMADALHSYHKFEYNEDLDVYIYTLIIPYDD